MTHRADFVNIPKFLICALAVTVFGAVSNRIISFPRSLKAEKYGSQENTPERATATPRVWLPLHSLRTPPTRTTSMLIMDGNTCNGRQIVC